MKTIDQTIQFAEIPEASPVEKLKEDIARIEGEGDKSLVYWKKVHWNYYSREMAPFNEQPTEEMGLEF